MYVYIPVHCTPTSMLTFELVLRYRSAYFSMFRSHVDVCNSIMSVCVYCRLEQLITHHNHKIYQRFFIFFSSLIYNYKWKHFLCSVSHSPPLFHHVVYCYHHTYTQMSSHERFAIAYTMKSR